MINSITVTNHLDESVTMELRFPEKSGFLIRSVDGLGPTKADINITNISGYDGALYNMARANSRNIVFTLTFVENSTIEETRHDCYKYFPLKKKIKIGIETDKRSLEVYGYVESNEPNIFDSEEGAIISVVCPDAYLYDTVPQNTVFSAITAEFEFPFSNESTTVNLIEFSSWNLDTTKTILYEGDSPVGIVIHIHATGSASDIEIINSDTLGSITIDSTKLIALLGSDISLGDDIYISTVKGDKYASLWRDGVEHNILNALGTDPEWFELDQGDNVFVYTAGSGLINLQFEINNQIAYMGI